MRADLIMDDFGDLVELRLLAVRATYRRDGTVLLSPVWHEWCGGGFEVITGSHDVKAAHLRRNPRASIVVCEQTPPYRGVEVRYHAQLIAEGASDAVKRIASRYLGAEAGAAYAESAGDDLLLRLQPGERLFGAGGPGGKAPGRIGWPVQPGRLAAAGSPGIPVISGPAGGDRRAVSSWRCGACPAGAPVGPRPRVLPRVALGARDRRGGAAAG